MDDQIPELTDDPTWIIDPIDGTTNFIHSYPESCISLALTICKELVIGIIYNPVNGDLYTAKKNEGSFLNGIKIKTSPSTGKFNYFNFDRINKNFILEIIIIKKKIILTNNNINNIIIARNNYFQN